MSLFEEHTMESMDSLTNVLFKMMGEEYCIINGLYEIVTEGEFREKMIGKVSSLKEFWDIYYQVSRDNDWTIGNETDDAEPDKLLIHMMRDKLLK